MKKNVFNLVIMDESGSMSVIHEQAVKGFNETLKTIRASAEVNPELSQRVSLITFNSCHIGKVYDMIPISKIEDMKYEDFCPDDCTPLYDAMGISLLEMQEKTTKEDCVLVTVITDGLENASVKYRGEQIKRLVNRVKEKGWLVTYIGANQDAEGVGNAMGIDNCLNFEQTAEGTAKMFAADSRSRLNYYTCLCCNEEMPKAKDFDYFGNRNKKQKDSSK
jgi:Mg-chelatase subunit ChlD